MSSRPTTAAERVAKWDRRYTGDHVKSIIDTDKPIMLENNTASTNDLVYYETLTKQVLNEEGVSVAEVADYLSYGRQLWKMKRRYAGETLSLEAAIVTGKWVARGLTQTILENIRSQVFSISPPAP